jgi:hypothetical protein
LRIYERSIEDNTLATYKPQLFHPVKTLGGHFSLNALTLEKLQQHVDRRKDEKGPPANPSPR